MSKESAIKFLRELRTNEKAKELLKGKEKPKSKEDVIKAYVEIAAELGEDLSAEDIAKALEEIEIEIHHNAEVVSADIVELDDDDIENVAGGDDGCINHSEGWCWKNDECVYSEIIYSCGADYD